MTIDYKTEHRENIKLSFQKVLIAIFRDAFVCWMIITLADFLFHDEIVSSFQNTTVRGILILIATVVLLYEIRYGRKLCSSLDDMYSLRELEIAGDQDSLIVCNRLIRSIERWVDIDKQKINIMTSLSPIPLTVIIIGMLIDKNKYNDLLWNQYTVLLIVVFLFYAIILYRSYDSYKECKYQLVRAKDAREKIAMKLKDKESHLPNT